MSREQEILDELYEHVLDGEAPPTIELTKEGLELDIDPLTLLFDAMIPALEEVGRLFEIGEYFVPEMLISARAMAPNPLAPLLWGLSKVISTTSAKIYVILCLKGPAFR